TMAGVDVDTLTMEQYLALSRENQAPGVVDRLALGTINTWDLLKKAFIQRYCPPFMTAKQLEDIHNFKQEGDESLYQAWERAVDKLFEHFCLCFAKAIESESSSTSDPRLCIMRGIEMEIHGVLIPVTITDLVHQCIEDDCRFGGNDATKKTQKALLKQYYENFNAISSESLDSIFNRLQKLVSRLAILGVDTPPEDLNVKFLRSLPLEWDTHVVVWMNKPDFATYGLVDFVINFKIGFEQKVKRTYWQLKVKFLLVTKSTASFVDATVYAFLSTQPQGSQLVHEDLEQIHDDDLEEMDLKWNMALLSMRARKFYQRTGRKIIIDGSSTAGYDKSKVECFNCHKMGHFARECRVPRSKDNRNWNQGSSSKAVRIEDASEKAMCAIDGGGFDWSDMAEDEIQANMALMAFTDSEVSNDKSCSKSCLQNYEALKKQYDDLLVKLDDTAFKAATYKRGLSILEAQVVKYKESEVLFSEEIALLKRSVGHKDYLMGLVKTELEKVKEEKEGFEFKLAKFEKSSKDLDDLLASQVTDKSKRGFGYTVVPSPHPLILNRPTPLDLSYSGLEEFKQPEVNGYGPRDSSLKPTTVCDRESNNSKENTDDSLNPTNPRTVTETARCGRENTDAPLLKIGCQMMRKKLSLSLSRKRKYLMLLRKHMVPKAVLMRTGLKTIKNANPLSTVKSVNTVRPFSTAKFVNTVRPYNTAHPKPTVSCARPKTHFQNQAQRPFYKNTTLTKRHMSGNIAHLSVSKEFDGGYVTFVEGKWRKNTGKGFENDQTCVAVLKASNIEHFLMAGPIPTLRTQPSEDQEIELGNISPSYEVSSTPHTRIHKDHPIDHVIGDVQSSVQTRRMTTSYSELGFVGAIYEGKTHQDLHTCLFAYFLSQEEPKRVSKALNGLQKQESERGIVLEQSSDLCPRTYQEDGFDLTEVFAQWLGLRANKNSSVRGGATYLLSNGFQRGQIDQTLFIKSQQGHILLVQIYVDDIIFGSTKKELCEEFEKLMKDKFQMSSMGELTFFLGLQFNYTDVKSASTPTDLEKPLVKDADADDVDEHLYRSMIGSLMYLTASRPDIMFAVCACASDLLTKGFDAGRFLGLGFKSWNDQSLRPKFLFVLVKSKRATGKDLPNPLIVVNVLKTIRFLNGTCFSNEALASPGANAMASPKQTAIGKDSSNPFMAGSLPKTTLCHNMVAFLEKSTGSAGFHQIIDFISRSHICYALTKKPEVCVSFIKQFWRSAEALTDDNGAVKINATIDGHSLSITEGSLRRHLKLDDQDGINSLPTTEIFAQLALMGYATDSDKLTFQKGAFSPQWRFLIHNILHCLSPKKTAWEQFSSNIAVAVICLATNRKFNFSRMIFDHMVSNISSPHKFLMYPRFVQLCLDMQRHKLQQHTRVYSVPSLTMKVFSNMKRITKGFSGQEVALFPNMLAVPTPSASPSNIISSPEPTPTQPSPTQPSPQPSPIQPSPTQLSPTQPGSEYHPPTPHDSPLHAVHSHGSDEGSLKLQELMNLINTLSDRIGVLEADLTKTKKTYSSAYTKLILRVKKLELQIRWEARLEEQMNEGNKVLKLLEMRRLLDSVDEEERKRAMDAAKILSLCMKSKKYKVKSPEKRSLLKRLWRRGCYKGKREEVGQEPAAKRKKSIPRKTTRKRQKLEEDAEKDELKGFLDIVPREEAPIEVESLSTKFPIVDWKTCVLTETFMYYQVFRGDGSSKNYKVLSEMLEDFDEWDARRNCSD
ncbi:putative ribonuclease H-like domain-containing protein, partial [Tanacetum coccineum]